VSRLTAEALLDALSTAREPVGAIWRRLGVTRAEFQRFINANYDYLVKGQMRLYTATTSQASSTRLHIEVDGIRYSHISIDVLKEVQPMGMRLSDIVERTRQWL
jgi:hypothetical protein